MTNAPHTAPWASGYDAGKKSQQGELEWYRERINQLREDIRLLSADNIRLRADSAALLVALRAVKYWTTPNETKIPFPLKQVADAIARALGRAVADAIARAEGRDV